MNRTVLPGFRLAMGYTIVYLSLLVLIPLSTLFFKTAGIGWSGFWDAATSPRVMSAYRLSFSTAMISALVNVGFGTLVAWTLVRYTFPFKSMVDALVDLRLDLDGEWRIAGVSNDSRGRVSSMDVYRPIDGR